VNCTKIASVTALSPAAVNLVDIRASLAMIAFVVEGCSAGMKEPSDSQI
jgi:hypothetical protein